MYILIFMLFFVLLCSLVGTKEDIIYIKIMQYLYTRSWAIIKHHQGIPAETRNIFFCVDHHSITKQHADHSPIYFYFCIFCLSCCVNFLFKQRRFIEKMAGSCILTKSCICVYVYVFFCFLYVMYYKQEQTCIPGPR